MNLALMVGHVRRFCGVLPIRTSWTGFELSSLVPIDSFEGELVSESFTNGRSLSRGGVGDIGYTLSYIGR